MEFLQEIAPVALIIVSILLIAIVLLQSGKAESAGQIVQGGNSDLLCNELVSDEELASAKMRLKQKRLYSNLMKKNWSKNWFVWDYVVIGESKVYLVVMEVKKMK